MKSETIFCLDSSGDFCEVVIAANKLEINDTFVSTLASRIPRKVRNLCKIKSKAFEDYVFVSASVLPSGGCVFSIPIVAINLDATYTIQEKVIWATFSKEDQRMILKWNAPGDMSLVFLVHVESTGVIGSYLVATNSQGVNYRLPFGNIYEDCKMCGGSYVSASSSLLESAERALWQFENSPWNVDLAKPEYAKAGGKLHSLASWNISNDEFVQVECLDWEANCEKVSVDFITKNIINHKP